MPSLHIGWYGPFITCDFQENPFDMNNRVILQIIIK